MSRRHLLWIPALVASVAAASASGQPQPSAKAVLHHAAGVVLGTLTLTPTVRGTAVQINGTLKPLPPGVHAFHIHTVGKCDPPDFTSAGGHLNPAGKQHGKDNPNGAHLGDLPNFEVVADGVGNISYAVPDITLGDGPNSLFHPGGTALVIHANPDDYKTDPTGNAGARIACGVIEKQ
jgi:Cu-Zn family superoxide dismutase